MSAAVLATLADSRGAYRSGWVRGWHITSKLSVSVWADRHRRLTRETSKEPGQWRTDRTPYLRAIMDALSDASPVIRVTLCFGTQLGKTEVGNNFVAYVIAYGLGSMLVVQPTGDMGKRWSRQRFDVMRESTPVLLERISEPRSRDAQNAMAMKRYPGGYIIVGHAESAASLSSLPARFTFLDEVDSYPIDTGGEGDPIALAERRTDSFGRRRKNLRVSSPKKLKGASLIWREYEAGDQSLYLVPCLRCGHMQALEVEGLLPTGEYLCEDCGRGIDHRDKTAMLAEGDWVAARPELSAFHRSFRLPTTYAPIGLGPTWKELYIEREGTGDDPIAVKTFVSTRAARPYEATEGKIEIDDLKSCREDWHMREIPVGCLLLCASIDVQGNRLELQLMGFGRGPQIYIIDYAVIPGSPLEQKTWVDADDYLSRPITNHYNVDMIPGFVAVDSGNWTQEVYAHVFSRRAKGWVSVKGSSQANAPLVSPPKRHSFTWQGRYLKNGDHHHMVGTNVAKDTIIGRLAIMPRQQREDRWWHLPADLLDVWFEQIVSERRDPETGTWEKVSARARNEILDVSGYAWAVAHLPDRFRLGTLREKEWKRIEGQVEPRVGDLFAQPPKPVANPAKANLSALRVC